MLNPLNRLMVRTVIPMGLRVPMERQQMGHQQLLKAMPRLRSPRRNHLKGV